MLFESVFWLPDKIFNHHSHPLQYEFPKVCPLIFLLLHDLSLQFEGELFLCPGFPAPPDLDLTGYHSYVDERLPSESPGLYSMHPNAEIEFMTATSDALFKTLLELQPRDSSTGEGASQCTEEKVKLCIIIIIVIIIMCSYFKCSHF